MINTASTWSTRPQRRIAQNAVESARSSARRLLDKRREHGVKGAYGLARLDSRVNHHAQIAAGLAITEVRCWS